MITKSRKKTQHGKPGNVSEKLNFNSETETDVSRDCKTEPSRKQNVLDDMLVGFEKKKQLKVYISFVSSQNRLS